MEIIDTDGKNNISPRYVDIGDDARLALEAIAHDRSFGDEFVDHRVWMKTLMATPITRKNVEKRARELPTIAEIPHSGNAHDTEASLPAPDQP